MSDIEPVNTRKVDRRDLRFGSLDDLERELERLAAAQRDGRLTHSGNYTPGQVLFHLARWMERYHKRDLPRGLPLHLRLLGRLMRRRVLRKGFPAGLSGPEGSKQPEPETAFEDGLAYLLRMHEVLRTSDLGQPNEVLGSLTHAQVTQLHLRHAELHLGFLRVEDETMAGSLREGSEPHSEGNTR